MTGAVRLATGAGVKLSSTDVGNLRLGLMGLLPNLAELVLGLRGRTQRASMKTIPWRWEPKGPGLARHMFMDAGGEAI